MFIGVRVNSVLVARTSTLIRYSYETGKNYGGGQALSLIDGLD